MERRSVPTLAGTVELVFLPTGLYGLSLPSEVAGRHPPVTENDPLWLRRLEEELVSYFAGVPVTFSCPVDKSGYPPFFARVLSRAAGIPYGESLTYRALADASGSPRAARAAGQAMAANRTPVVIPCHRVIGAGGALGGYSGGLDWKKTLLALEQTGKTPCHG
jgi:methylated-DNA-[protein]-cysteine S-methyltransferase